MKTTLELLAEFVDQASEYRVMNQQQFAKEVKEIIKNCKGYEEIWLKTAYENGQRNPVKLFSDWKEEYFKQ